MLPDGRDTYRTFVGFVLSIFTFTTMMAYGSYKVTQLLDYENYVVQQRDFENKFDMNSTFGSSDQFAVAAGIFDHKSRATKLKKIDPEIGALKFYY